jgi:hypothetical protein
MPTGPRHGRGSVLVGPLPGFVESKQIAATPCPVFRPPRGSACSNGATRPGAPDVGRLASARLGRPCGLPGRARPPSAAGWCMPGPRTRPRRRDPVLGALHLPQASGLHRSGLDGLTIGSTPPGRGRRAKRRPQFASTPKACLDPIEVNPAVKTSRHPRFAFRVWSGWRELKPHCQLGY